MFRSTRNAFTLIELLVVIAIIAILAAILFPVFAQAREKARQTVCISNLKQDSLAVMQYVQDYDETFPQAGPLDVYGGEWLSGSSGPGGAFSAKIWTTPANNRPITSASGQLRAVTWGNSIQPYIKNYGVYDCPSTDSIPNGGTVFNSTPPRVAFTFNGDLQMYTDAGILAPAAVIMFWTGHQKNAWVGYSDSNPQLNCPDPTSACIYQPTANANGNCPQANGGTDVLIVYGGQNNYTVWVHGQGDNFLYTDGHAKWVPLHTDYHTDPFGYEDKNGGIIDPNGYYYPWEDGCHAYLFRPDYQP
jgi:prepilin-type N-terminal cleavage/methylation domain-containing protein